jgi:hypothetical protein
MIGFALGLGIIAVGLIDLYLISRRKSAWHRRRGRQSLPPKTFYPDM